MSVFINSKKFKRTTQQPRSFWSTLGCAALLLLSSGCEKDWHAKTYPAKGTLSINGSPAEGALIMLHSTGDRIDSYESTPFGVVDAEGHYTLRTYSAGDGAPKGEYAVVLCWRWDLGNPKSRDRLNEAYFNPANPIMTVTINPGSNELPPINLNNVKVAPKGKAETNPTW